MDESRLDESWVGRKQSWTIKGWTKTGWTKMNWTKSGSTLSRGVSCHSRPIYLGFSLMSTGLHLNESMVNTHNLQHQRILYNKTYKIIGWWNKGDVGNKHFSSTLKERGSFQPHRFMSNVVCLIITSVPKAAHRENLYHFPIDLESNGRPFGSKSIEKW